MHDIENCPCPCVVFYVPQTSGDFVLFCKMYSRERGEIKQYQCRDGGYCMIDPSLRFSVGCAADLRFLATCQLPFKH